MAQRHLSKVSRFGAGLAAGIVVVGLGMRFRSSPHTTNNDDPSSPDVLDHRTADTYVKRTWLVLSLAMLLAATSVLILILGFLAMVFSTFGLDRDLNGGNFHASFPVCAALLAALLWAAFTSLSRHTQGENRSKQWAKNVERIMPVLALSAALGVTISFAVPALPNLDPDRIEMYGAIGMFFLVPSASYPFLFACRTQLEYFNRTRASRPLQAPKKTTGNRPPGTVDT